MYSIKNEYLGGQIVGQVIIRNDGDSITSFGINPDNTDYQAFKTAVLEQQPNTLIDNGDSFSMSSDESILENSDESKMTIDEAKAYVRTLP